LERVTRFRRGCRYGQRGRKEERGQKGQHDPHGENSAALAAHPLGTLLKRARAHGSAPLDGFRGDLSLIDDVGPCGEIGENAE
jgi:hypothetical protein